VTNAEDVRERLASRTLDLVNVPSPSREEAAAIGWVRERMPVSLSLLDDGDAVLFYGPSARRVDAPFVVLAGHLDTVPIADNVPGAVEDGHVIGRGAADMKGSLAVMLEVAARDRPSDVDVGFLFFGREELPITESALLPLFARYPETAAIDLAIVMEPTDNAIEVGCLGNLNARVLVTGTAAHSARPWLGDNAIHRALDVLRPVAERGVEDVEIEGLVYREAVSVTTIEGGTAGNVVPDRVEARVNLRYAPSRTPQEAEALLRGLIGGPSVEVEIVGNAPPGPVTVSNPLVARLRDVAGLTVRPKQAWTPVAEFATIGVDAINLGPGDPQYAHRRDERVRVDALVRAYEVLETFLTAGPDVRTEEG
jgi:succinyl-diaminopimelate desuccinylase